MVNCLGEAVALNAGGKNKAASAFYLPLERVVRALRLLQVSSCTLNARASPEFSMRPCGTGSAIFQAGHAMLGVIQGSTWLMLATGMPRHWGASRCMARSSHPPG